MERVIYEAALTDCNVVSLWSIIPTLWYCWNHPELRELFPRSAVMAVNSMPQLTTS